MWFLWYLAALAVSFGIYFLYRIGPRTFVVYAVLLFFGFWMFGGTGLELLGGLVQSKMGSSASLRPKSNTVNEVIIPLDPVKRSEPLDIDGCVSWQTHPEPGQTVYVAAADDRYTKEYRFGPDESPVVPGRGPFVFWGGGKTVRVKMKQLPIPCDEQISKRGGRRR